jgi:hypothetical protein
MVLPRAFLVVLLAHGFLPGLAAQGRRVVDVVTVGDASSERQHDYAGTDAIEGRIDGRTYRRVRGWLSYSMAAYEDSEVALGCTVRGSEGRALVFALSVEGQTIATKTLVSPSSQPVNLEFRVPFEITRGLTGIHVTVRAVKGPAPDLLELRTVQEHLERPAAAAPGPISEAIW